MKSWMIPVAVIITLVTVGCGDNVTHPKGSGTQQPSSSPTPIAKPEPVHAKTEPVPTKPEPLLHGWEKPAAALLLTGEQHGYFEPCGCALHQLGGMSRRGDLFRILTEERQWPVAGLDLGGALKRDRRQDVIKFEELLVAFKHLNYAGMALGVEELKLGADVLATQQISDPEEAKHAVALLGANVQLYDPPFPDWPLPYRIVQVGAVKIGVTAITGLSLQDKVAPVGTTTNITIKDPFEVLPDVIAKLEAEKPAFLVLLSHGSGKEARELATKFPQFRIILTAGGPEEADVKPVVVGKTWILEAGHKGKRVGVLGYYPDNTEEPFKYDLVALDDERFKDDPFMRHLMRDFQERIQIEGLATSDDLVLKHESGNTFIGAAKCGECHKRAYDVWKETTHAKALNSLKVGRGEKDWIVRTHDPECLSCHVTGWEPQQMLRFDSGYFNEERTPHLVGNQCENCHGPGSKHVALEEALAAKLPDVDMVAVEASRKKARITLEDAKLKTCVECHDADNSPKFKPDAFDDFWEQIKHPFKD